MAMGLRAPNQPNVFTYDEIATISEYLGVMSKDVTAIGWLAWCKQHDLEVVDAEWVEAATT